MINEALKTIAIELANKNKVLAPKANSVLVVDNQDEVVIKLSSLIANEVSTYRNLLIPFIKDYRSKVEEIVNQRLSNININDIEVETIEVPLILKEYVKRDIIGASDSQVILPISSISIPTPSVEDIKRYLHSESPIINDYINELLNEFTDEELLNVWEKYLGNISKSNDNLTMVRIYAPINVNEVMLTYLLTDKLMDNIPEGIVASAETYNKVMGLLKDKLRNDLTYIYKQMLNALDTKRLVAKVDGKTVYVHKEVYGEFLKEFPVEVLFGLAIDKDAKLVNKHYLYDIKTSADVYAANWKQYVKMKKLAVDEIGIYRMAYTVAIGDALKEAPSEINEYLVNDNVGQLENIIRDEVRNEPLYELKDTVAMSRELISEYIFDNENFEKFLENMTDYSKTNPELNSKEVASLAVLDMVIDYLTMQVTTK